jgi:mercuric ion transport protein
MGLITRIAGKTGALGSVVSAMGCAACFPAIASFGAAIGLGFLRAQYEGLFIGILLPMFAGIALLANAIAWLNHRQWRRTALGTIGPILVLAAVFLMRAYGWQSGGLLYVGPALMVGVSVWDFISPHIAAAGRTAVNCQNNVADGNSRSHHRKGKIHDHPENHRDDLRLVRGSRQGSLGESARRAIGAGVLSEGHSATRH